MLGDIFDDLENLKNENEIYGYTVHQVTLEQIFLKLTDEQNDGTGQHQRTDQNDEKQKETNM